MVVDYRGRVHHWRLRLVESLGALGLDLSSWVWCGCVLGKRQPFICAELSRKGKLSLSFMTLKSVESHVNHVTK